MKIIGWLKKGNVVRFALGEDNQAAWSGDDWDVAPYENVAKTVPLFGIADYMDVAFPFSATVLEPTEFAPYRESTPYSMESFKSRKVPILLVNGEKAILMGDRIEDIDWYSIGATLLTM